MDFKSYYRQKIAEELDQNAVLDADAPQAPAQQNQAQAQAANQEAPQSDDPDDAKIPNSPLYGLVKSYIAKDPKMKIALSIMAKDLSEAIWRYAALEYAKKEDFDSMDDWKNYKNAIRDKVAETYGKTMLELYKNIGIFVSNTANNIAAK